MASTEGNSLSLASRTIAQLRALIRSFPLANVYSLLSRSQLIDPLQQVLPQQLPVANKYGPVAVVTSAAAGGSEVTFLPRDPQWAYVFWRLGSSDQQRAAAAGASQLCLRVSDVTGLQTGASHPHALQEVVVDARISEWYLAVPLCDRDYRVELGYHLPSGGWLHLAFSSVARMPASGPSEVVADLFVPFSLAVLPSLLSTFAPVQGGSGVEHELMYRQSTAASASRRRFGSEVWHEHRSAGQLGDQWLSSASGAGLWASGRSESGRDQAQPRSFWLVADAELIVYGATEPSASLFIGDAPVPLSSDGTFQMQMPFRDGQQLYPIRAVAAAGEQERWVRLEFQRSTAEAQVNSKEEALVEWF